MCHVLKNDASLYLSVLHSNRDHDTHLTYSLVNREYLYVPRTDKEIVDFPVLKTCVQTIDDTSRHIILSKNPVRKHCSLQDQPCCTGLLLCFEYTDSNFTFVFFQENHYVLNSKKFMATFASGTHTTQQEVKKEGEGINIKHPIRLA